jgi:hypothetical protein
MTDHDLDQIRAAVGDALTPVQAQLAEHTRMLALLQQDTALIRGTVTGHTQMLASLAQDVRLLRAAINDIAKENVTPGEIAAIHHDLSRLQVQVAELSGRLEMVEGRDRH